MSLPSRPLPVKPLVSLIFSQPALETAVFRDLAAFLGPPDMVSAWLHFHQTGYYAPEMGLNLQRRLAVFLHLADPSDLCHWKACTNDLERRFSLSGRRLVNLDPGYLSRERLVLATGKNYTHRLYLGQGFYGEVTLIYQKGSWRALPWTYPDYASEPLRGFFTQARQKYLWQLRQLARKVEVEEKAPENLP
ncbi:DUF4416 family protein [Desulfobacca acetoxidans]|uniref:GTP-binding protein n=1 Tax=Desulfobacca acetoxidans (strain ATCC 700848 / DSM 11109 / ASRB2) TaxID=880072 RepID=F2NGV1_DESAR|nr:DUF4416 family protein [Desulfobacca acetoxidans]AEB08722.1 GTP-binding protein [Desulfobacca acetoxidans DSM 11109]HAY21632.1 DUF4416 domain-containing protein [Desulfobacterales bacterium]